MIFEFPDKWRNRYVSESRNGETKFLMTTMQFNG
jgi:hypothetical protein